MVTEGMEDGKGMEGMEGERREREGKCEKEKSDRYKNERE
jgi:hypothetical protein